MDRNKLDDLEERVSKLEADRSEVVSLLWTLFIAWLVVTLWKWVF